MPENYIQYIIFDLLLAERYFNSVGEYIRVAKRQFTRGIRTFTELNSENTGIYIGDYASVNDRFMPSFIGFELHFAADNFLDILTYM